jgi:hypothetical protein
MKSQNEQMELDSNQEGNIMDNRKLNEMIKNAMLNKDNKDK